MEKLSGLSHLFMTIFLHNFSIFMVIPAITDVTMSALCPGRDECSLAIYLTGFQQAVRNFFNPTFIYNYYFLPISILIFSVAISLFTLLQFLLAKIKLGVISFSPLKVRGHRQCYYELTNQQHFNFRNSFLFCF